MRWSALLISATSIFLFLIPTITSVDAQPPAADAVSPTPIRIQGVVVDEDGIPIPNALIQTKSLIESKHYRTTSQESGLFLLHIPSTANVGNLLYETNLLVTDPENQRASFVYKLDVNREKRRTFRVVLAPWRSTTVSVFDAMKSIFEWMPKDFEGLSRFFISHPNFHCPTPIQMNALDLRIANEMVAKLQRYAIIRGQVTNSINKPVADIRIQSTGIDNGSLRFRGETMSNSDGTLELRVAPNQKISLSLVDDFFATKSLSLNALDEGEVQEKVNIVIQKGTIIRGTITVGNSRLACPNQYVTLIQDANGDNQSSIRWSETDDDGHYSFCVGPGKFSLRLRSGSAQEEKIEVEDEAEFVRDGHFDRLPRSSLKGTVAAPSGKLLSNAKVLGESIQEIGHAGFKTASSNQGEFAIERWNDRMLLYSYHLEERLAGFFRLSEDDLETKLQLSPAATLRGKLVDSAGRPLPDRIVSIIMSPIGNMAAGKDFSIVLKTDKQGNFSYSGVPVGTRCRVHGEQKVRIVVVEEAKEILIEPIVER